MRLRDGGYHCRDPTAKGPGGSPTRPSHGPVLSGRGKGQGGLSTIGDGMYRGSSACWRVQCSSGGAAGGPGRSGGGVASFGGGGGIVHSPLKL